MKSEAGKSIEVSHIGGEEIQLTHNLLPLEHISRRVEPQLSQYGVAGILPVPFLLGKCSLEFRLLPLKV